MSAIATCTPPDHERTFGSAGPKAVPAANASLAVWIRQPWMVRVGTGTESPNVLMRGTSPRDFTALAAMHRRCSAGSLLERYRAGGRPPSTAAVERMLRRSLSFVACTARGEIIAAAVAANDPVHPGNAAEIGLLVEDEWQHRGIGRDLACHLAGAAYVFGYTELISYTGTSIVPVRRLLTEIGRTFAVLHHSSPHLHTYLSESSALGLGAIREHLAC
jgi:GNAT superfamily N-acetyltransferase